MKENKWLKQQIMMIKSMLEEKDKCINEKNNYIIEV